MNKPEFCKMLKEVLMEALTEDIKEDFRDNMAIGSKPCGVYADNHELHLLLNRAVAAEMEVERWKDAARKLAWDYFRIILEEKVIGSSDLAKHCVADIAGLSVKELFEGTND